MDTGYAEFNDAASKICGIMVAGRGSFSGTFSAQNINAISHINVRDGAVSAYLGFSFPTSVRTAAFAVPHQKETAIADISIPISVMARGPSEKYPATVRLYKNGTLLESSSISLKLSDYFNKYSSARSKIGFPQVVRFIDTEVVADSFYNVELINGSGTYKEGNSKTGYTLSGYVNLNLISTITVGFRKR